MLLPQSTMTNLKEIIMRNVVLGAAALCVSAGLPACASDIATAEALVHHSVQRPACHDVARRTLGPLETRLHGNAQPKPGPAATAQIAAEAVRSRPRIALMLGVGF
jgi:hypothetical protein